MNNKTQETYGTFSVISDKGSTKSFGAHTLVILVLGSAEAGRLRVQGGAIEEVLVSRPRETSKQRETCL